MTNRNQFEASAKLPDACALCEALLPDAVDGTLSPAEQAVLDRHVAGCADCAAEFAAAQRGAAWLGMLKTHAPEPPAALLQRILADTTGASTPQIAVATPVPAWPAVGWAPLPKQPPAARPSRWFSLRQQLADVVRIESSHANFQPRLVMTAAMAFFSVALSLNLGGVRLRDLRAADFSPLAVRRVVADAGATAERRFQNLRVVYQLESRVNDLRNGGPNADDGGGLPQAATEPEARPEAPQSVSPRVSPQHRQNQTKPQGSSQLRAPGASSPVLEATL